MTMVVYEVSDHLRIGLRCELVPQSLQACALFVMVFDDAVVHNGDLVP